jgi:hypothetical protein
MSCYPPSEEVTLRFDAMCEECDGEMPRGSSAMFVEGLRGLRHRECAHHLDQESTMCPSQLPDDHSSEHSPMDDLSLLLEQARSMDEDLDAFSPEEVAGVALSLARIFSEVSSSIDPLKALLRLAAREMLVDQGKAKGKVSIEGVSELGEILGEVSVTFPASQLKLSKNFDPQALKELLGSELFDSFFETKTTYKPSRSFSVELADLYPLEGKEAESKALLGAIERVEPTPRVGFPSARDK